MEFLCVGSSVEAVQHRRLAEGAPRFPATPVECGVGHSSRAIACYRSVQKFLNFIPGSSGERHPAGTPQRLQNLFCEWMRSRDTVGDAHERCPSEPCSGATGRVQKPFCARSTKSQAVDISPNRFSRTSSRIGMPSAPNRCAGSVRSAPSTNGGRNVDSASLSM